MKFDSESVTRLSAVACIALAATAAAFYGWGAAILVLASGALCFAIHLFWRSLQGLAGEAELTLHEALELAAPTAEEEQKVAVLRALKDLEYERSVGKITDEDYTELSRRYRAQAKQLLRHLDAELEPARKAAEEELAAHLKQLGGEAKPATKPSTDDTPADGATNAEEPQDATTLCKDCGTENDNDASFCKKCGQPMNAEVEA